MPRVDAWTHEEMILLLNLYLKLPFGKMDRRNPDVIHLANIIGRTPNAVALRLVNYASYDPQLQRRGISGMAHGYITTNPQLVWETYTSDLPLLKKQVEQFIEELKNIVEPLKP